MNKGIHSGKTGSFAMEKKQMKKSTNIGKIDENSLNEIGIKGYSILGMSFILVMILGIWGFSISYSASGIQYGVLDIVYSTLQLFVLEFRLTTPVNNIQLQIARFLAPLLTLSTLTILICVSVESLQKISLRFKKNHTIQN